MKFYELDLSDEVLDALDAMNFDECTPIQEQSIPLALEGRDLIAVAQTGTGKTAAYLLPVIDSLAGGGYPEDAINCVVMSPTRELAQQIDRQMEGFSYYLPVNSLAIFGGTDGPEFARQQRGLKMGADVVIATPGRLLAHLQMGYVDLSRVSFFILDEADRMLDMGFYDDIMTIAKQLPPTCQTLMFSATMPPKIQRMAEAILKNPAEVKLEVSKPAENIRQSAFVCYEGQKTPILRSLFKTRANKRVIVFASSKLKVKELTRELRRAGVKAAEMHSDLEQARRDEVMLDFRAGRIDILVATDIVARGIDIDDIAFMPPPDDKGVVIVENIVMKPGRYGYNIYMTPGTIEITSAAEGDTDKIGFTPSIKFEHPGNEKEVREFKANSINRKFIVVVRYCSGKPSDLIGTICNPCKLTPSYTGNNESNSNEKVFSKAKPKSGQI